MRTRATIVIDVGKTVTKASLWAPDGTQIARLSRANPVLDGILDTGGIEAWLEITLSEFALLADTGAIIPVAHGAAAAMILDGKLAFAPRDYEAPIPPEVRARYDQRRGPFSKTGSPALPDGLNLGAQLYAQRDKIAGMILLWPQYWSWLLSNIAASEVTSLGCHTDLWCPATAAFSVLADEMQWTARFPPLCHAGSVLGAITPGWAARTGLPSDTHIYCGIHDSNAALVAARSFPEIAGRDATVLSTGTWFVAMRSAVVSDAANALSETRDCLINVDVEGLPVPSARFMGGREIEMLGERIDQPGLAGVLEVISGSAMVLPAFAPGCGPFPHGAGTWVNEPVLSDQRRAAIALYTALVADSALDLIGARGTLLIEGRFAAAEIFVRALATLRPDTQIYTSIAQADVSFGALRLVDPSITPVGKLERVTPLGHDLAAYRAEWHQRINEGKAA